MVFGFGKKVAPANPKANAGKALFQLMRNVQTGKKEKNDLQTFLNTTKNINMNYQDDQDGYTALDIAGILTDKSIEALLKEKGATMKKENYNNATNAKAANAKAAAPKKSWFSSSATSKNTSKNGNFTRKYKIVKNVKNYKPMPVGKRSSLLNRGGKKKHLNIIYALDHYDKTNVNADKVVKIAKERYQKLHDTKPLTPDNILEMNTLYYLLKNIGMLEGLPSPTGSNASKNTHNYGPEVLVNAANAANASKPANAANAAAQKFSLPARPNNPTPLAPNSPTVSNTGDPTIEGTIQRMKCTVCESQSIIDKALKPGEAPRKCDMCGAKAVVPSTNPFNSPAPIPARNPFNNTPFNQFNATTDAPEKINIVVNNKPNNNSAPSSPLSTSSNSSTSSSNSASAPRIPGGNNLSNEEAGVKHSMVGGRRSTRKNRKNTRRN